jgi:two-component system, OmpR family, phosphate regulon sensor histidine kinase PhoR
MASSILLLILLQIFWLTNSYRNAYSDLRRETNSIFRSAVFSMWDSVLATAIRPMPFDSLVNGSKAAFSKTDSSSIIARVENNVIRRGTKDSVAMKVIFSTRDSLPDDAIRPLVARLNRTPLNGDKANHTFIIRIGSDTIDRQKLRAKLDDAFAQNNVDLPFAISLRKKDDMSAPDEFMQMHRGLMFRKKRLDSPRVEETGPGGEIISEPVSVSPIASYTLTLNKIQPELLSRIGPEIFFSLVLTSLTATAFLLMYRNIRSQQRLVKSKNEFINNVTHELKTPVATVSVALEAIQNFNVNQNPELTKEYLQIAQRELTRLNEITDRILKTSVLENDIIITKETSDLDEITRTVISDMKIILNQRNATLSFKKEGEDFSIHCDPYHSYQVVQNLIDNALKYSSDEPAIEIALEGTEKFVQFRISDHGIGIPKEYQNKIFEKFYRVPTGDIHTVRGYGLGLNYVQNLVKSLGGKVNVESEPEKGSTFTLTFPRLKVRHISIKIGNH